MPGVAEEAADAVETGAYIRLHVVAASDTLRDQAAKLQVRDAVLAEARLLLADCRCAEDAWRAVNDHREGFARAAEVRLRALGMNCGATCRAGVFAFPERQYGDITVQAGAYRALRVVIGVGAGHNWWCVLYPDLCYSAEVKPGEPVRFHSTLWNWLMALLGGGNT